ncbi:putative hydrolase of the HAD superfamily [Plasticicumulans lactativorans]|uniref:Putative hydrolase of the HAD superfamily n=1 Tax=Plasticicumulans lactativorans TaxID=1133106 RepID=A0A4R2L985_9GAMM|nr:HAD family hydrolase [Plasticicumulans lactativorans]TCO80809.1 putative hydrolase of the HAD superfamily [Plasticicumulans lactativorans]
MAGPVRALSFDLDDTFWDVWAAVARAEAALHAWLAERHPPIAARYTPLGLRALGAEIAQAEPAIALDLSERRRRALCLAAERCGCARGFVVEEAFAVFYASRNRVEFFPGVLAVLERLAAHYPLIALSNGNADLGLVGIAHHFRFALNAVAVGAPKPDPRMFLAAAERLGLTPGTIVHIGDHPEHDVLGALRSGYRSVWFNPGGAAWAAPDYRPDAEIAAFDQLEAVLQRWD